MTEEEYLDVQDFIAQRNAYNELMSDRDMIAEEEAGKLVSKLVLFENCHLVANELFNTKPLIARALRNELNIYLKGK